MLRHIHCQSLESGALQSESRIYKLGLQTVQVFVLAALSLAAEHAAAQSPAEFVEQALEAAEAAEQGGNAKAIELSTQAIQKDEAFADAYKVRGRELFRAGRVKESVVDFDKYVELRKDLAPRQWERGIALYYAGRHSDGAKQFELYQSFDGHDVENSVWRFLCMAPSSGVAKAQAMMLPIENDRRIPMRQIYDMFRGKTTPEEVLKAARTDPPTETALASRLFYAHLYLGLWFDANGQLEEARRYIDLAANKELERNPNLNRYMWDVARIHQKKLRGELKID